MKYMVLSIMFLIMGSFYAFDMLNFGTGVGLRSEEVPFYYQGMERNYFKDIDIEREDYMASREVSEYVKTFVVYNIISAMDQVPVNDRSSKYIIRRLMNTAIKFKADQYYMFFEFMKRKNRSDNALIWMKEYISCKLYEVHSGSTLYTDMILADYLRCLGMLNAKNIAPKMQVMHHFTLCRIMLYEAERCSVLSRLSKNELQKLKKFCNALEDPMECRVSVFLEEYEKGGHDIMSVFKRYCPESSYPSTRDDVMMVPLGVRLAIYKILLSADVHSSVAEVWYKYLYDRGEFFARFACYQENLEKQNPESK